MDFFTVLVVDDEEDFLETIVKRLQKRNINTHGAKSGEEALEIISRIAVDVVILDVKMPGGMDGIETLREIKKLSPLTELILLTGHASVETTREGMRLGASDYLLKPVKLEELLPKLLQASEKRKRRIRRSGVPE
jgi:DNA-binding NtrC family response regulator